MEEIQKLLEQSLGKNMCQKIKYNSDWMHLIGMIQSYGNTQYNQALIDAAENADVEYMFGDEWQVDQQSILKLKKP